MIPDKLRFDGLTRPDG